MTLLRELPAAGSQADSLLQYNKSPVLNLERGFFPPFYPVFLLLLLFLSQEVLSPTSRIKAFDLESGASQ